MAWSRVTVTGNLSRLSSICVPLLVMAQRALRGLPASQAPTCGLAACAHLARHTYLPHQESPLSFSHFSNPCPDAAGSPGDRGALTSPSTEGRKVGASPHAYRRDAGCPRAPGQSSAEQGRGLCLEEVPRRVLQGVGRAEAKASRTKPTSGVGSKGSPRGQGKACRAAGLGTPRARQELTVPFLPCLRSSMLLTSLSRPCQSCPGSGLPQPLA